MAFLGIATVIVSLLLGVYWYLKNVCHTYWKRKGVPYIEPEFYYGNFREVIQMKKSSAYQFQKNYRELKSRGVKHGGVYMFFSPLYVPIDLDILKCILQKDFDHFVNRGIYHNEKDDPLSAHLVNLEDGKWRNLRAKLTPTFTSGKMKMMFQTLVECSHGMEKVLDDYATVQDALDIKDLLGRFTTDVIGSCAFGLDCESIKNPDSEFRKFGKQIFSPNSRSRIRFFITRLFPHNLLRKVGYRTMRNEIESFFMKVVKDTVDYREKNQVIRNDFMHLMLQLKNKGKVFDDENIFIGEKDNKNQDRLTMNEISAQCFVFFLAGFETSSTAMTFALYELARNQSIQDKLRNEIRSVLKKHDGKVTYDAVMEMSYLDKVVNEALRLHPPVPATIRVCNKAYRVPGTDVVLDAGVGVHIPIYGYHTDPEYYPNPEVFDPERFSEENKAKRPAYTFMPFGDGPRICIGLRFGLMQSKVGLIRVIKDHIVTLNEKTIDPLEYEPRTAILSVKDGVWLNVSRVDKIDQ